MNGIGFLPGCLMDKESESCVAWKMIVQSTIPPSRFASHPPGTSARRSTNTKEAWIKAYLDELEITETRPMVALRWERAKTARESASERQGVAGRRGRRPLQGAEAELPRRSVCGRRGVTGRRGRRPLHWSEMLRIPCSQGIRSDEKRHFLAKVPFFIPAWPCKANF